MFRVFRFIPLMGVVWALYNLIVVLYSDPAHSIWSQVIWQYVLPSGGVWRPTFSYLFITFALFVLFIELVKSTTASNAAMIEQTLSTLVFIGLLVQFLLQPKFVESTFFVLLVISLVEVLAGFIIITKVARRDVEIGD